MSELNDVALSSFNDALNFALDAGQDEPLVFLRMWREGDWDGIKEYYPDFDLTSTLEAQKI